jgi:hypothetical protein
VTGTCTHGVHCIGVFVMVVLNKLSSAGLAARSSLSSIHTSCSLIGGFHFSQKDSTVL